MKSQGREPKSKIKTPLIEWHVCDDESQWQQASLSTVDTVAPIEEQRVWDSRRMLRWSIATALLLLFIVAPIGWWLWNSAEAGLAEMQGELQTAVTSDIWTATHIPATEKADNKQNHFDAALLQGDADADEEVIGVEIRNIGQDWAVIQVMIRLQPSGDSYRQTRIYQQSQSGWLRAELTSTMWGDARQLESEHFIFHYRSLDHQAVTQAVAQIESIYLTLNDTFSLTLPNDRKTVVVVDPQWTPQVRLHPVEQDAMQDEPIVIGSPAAILAPTALSEGTMMTQAVVLQLLDMLAAEATAYYDLPPHWQSLQEGLKLWHLWDLQLPLARWRQPLVRWLFWESLTENEAEKPAFDTFAQTLCADHELWMNSPLQVGIPIACLPQGETERVILKWRISSSSPGEIPLPRIVVQDQLYQRAPSTIPSDSKVNVVILATVVEYISTKYGPARLPVLLEALPEHQNWETLIPALFGVSVEDFQNGWHEFLRSQYGIAQSN